MSNQEISIEFSKARYDALKYSIAKQDTTIEQELAMHLYKLYYKYVPNQVREYVENCIEEAIPAAAQTDENPRQSEPLTSRRRNSRRSDVTELNANETLSAVAPESVEDQEEGQGMAMSM